MQKKTTLNNFELEKLGTSYEVVPPEAVFLCSWFLTTYVPVCCLFIFWLYVYDVFLYIILCLIVEQLKLMVQCMINDVYVEDAPRLGHAKLCMRAGQRPYSYFVAASPAVVVTAVMSVAKYHFSQAA